MKLALRILVFAACALVIAILASDSLAAPSVFRPPLNRNGSLAIVRGLDEDTIFLTHTDGSHRELFTAGESPAWSPDGKRIAYVFGMEVRVVNADGSNDSLVIIGQGPSWTAAGDLLVSSLGDIVFVPMPSGTPQHLTNTATVDERQPAASPDGKWIAFTSNQDVNDPATPLPQVDYNLWIMNTATFQSSQSLLWESNSGAYGGDPKWAPDSHRIAFTDGGDIWTTTPIANNQTNLTNDQPSQGFPAWSPDGKLIAYAEADPGLNPDGSKPSTIWTIDVDTGARKQITKDPSQQDTTPDWQPWPVQNGKIVFVKRDSETHLGMIEPDGTHETRFEGSFDRQITDLNVTPNGAQIGSVTSNGTEGFLAVFDFLDLPDLTFGGSSNIATFGWFPDNKHIAAATMAGELFDVPPSGTPANLTNTQDVTESVPAVSLDGQHIAFFSDQMPFSDPPVKGNSLGLWTMDFDGLNRQFLTQIQTGGAPFGAVNGNPISWSPDGSKIAYSSGFDVWTIDANGSNPTNLTDDSLFQYDVSWSPDGGLIAFDQGTLATFNAQIWTIDPISGVRNKIAGGDPNVAYSLPSWQPLWAPGSEKYFVWGDNRCDGRPHLTSLLDTLKLIAGLTPKHVPGCPWVGENGLTSLNTSGPWGDTNCDGLLNGLDVKDFFNYWLEIGPYNTAPQRAGGFGSDCPVIGSYPQFIPTG